MYIIEQEPNKIKNSPNKNKLLAAYDDLCNKFIFTNNIKKIEVLK